MRSLIKISKNTTELRGKVVHEKVGEKEGQKKIFNQNMGQLENMWMSYSAPRKESRFRKKLKILIS